MKLTLHRNQIALLLQGDYKARYEKLLAKAEEKHGGYLNVALELPKRPRTTGF